MFRNPLVVAALLVPRLAIAGDPAAIVAEGEALARQGEFSRAIERFKAADAITPSASHACLIGLVYTRRELWSQAEIFFARCRHTATPADPVPDWLTDAEQALAEKLKAVDAAPIGIQIEPALPDARVLVSSFPPDEHFAPQAIHLTQGTYVITATAAGRVAAHATITVTPSTAQIITLVLPPLPPPPPPPPPRSAVIGTDLLIGATGVALAGVAFHLLASYERGKLTDAAAADDPVAYDHHTSAFATTRALAIGCYATAILGGALGIVLRTHHHEQPVLTIGNGAAIVGIAWQR